MAKKFYAVRCGKKCGIYTSWDECKENIDGFKHAVYKGFMTLEEAQAFMGLESNETKPRDGAAAAYVDGSFDVNTKRYSYGMVILYNGAETTSCEAFDDPELAEMRNVAGEIQGAMEAMLYCVANDIKKLDIYYDYAGIEYWCTGAWKTNKPGTIHYKEYYDWMKQRLDIRFVKVRGHSGDKYNDMADKLAKSALGIGDQ
ncbi:MAG: ribonuclease H family protein [Clostridia bacterium]|nr:ribonuclease H family protein [Clostridia bacterium]